MHNAGRELNRLNTAATSAQRAARRPPPSGLLRHCMQLLPCDMGLAIVNCY